MKKTNAAVLALLYLSLLLKPFIPYVGYQINKVYIAKILCVNRDKPQLHCDGKCYLNKQLEKANDLDTQEEQVPAPKIDLDKLPTALIKNFELKSFGLKNKSLQLSNYTFSLSEFYLDIPTPPPKLPCIFV